MENQQLTNGCLDAWVIKRYVEKGWNQSHCTELCQSHVHLFNRSMLPLPVGVALESDSGDRYVNRSSSGPEQGGKFSGHPMCLNLGNSE